jgi:molybdopterin-guanine dinucleotide biosynthesis protein A
LSLELDHADAAAPEAMGFVLAGGRSSRMGEDKALVEFDSQPLVAHALRILRDAGLPAWIAGARSPLDQFAPVVEDKEPDRGPLAGICAALAASPARFSVFVPVDAPFLPPSLLRYLLNWSLKSGAAISTASLHGFTQTFPAVVDRSVLPGLTEELESGRGGCHSAFVAACDRLGRELAVIPVERAIEGGRVTHPAALSMDLWFLNLNARADLLRAESCRGDGIA